MKYVILFEVLLGSLLFSLSAQAQNCGTVDITKLSAGPGIGSLMQVSDTTCGNQGFICLDPNAEHLSAEVSQRVHAFALSQYMAGRQVAVKVDFGLTTTACGAGYPVIEEIASP